MAHMGEMRNGYEILYGKPQGTRPLERPSSRWEDNIKMDFIETALNVFYLIQMAQDRVQWRALVNTSSINCWGIP
jgi:hypothetical protein